MQAGSGYRPEIDGLRAFAVVAVIINHINGDVLRSGYLGVDVFFVISGYVITASLAGRAGRNPGQGAGAWFGEFYGRRIRRLLPALVVMTLITGLLACLLCPEPGIALKTGITALFGLSNLYLLRIATDYFAPSTELNPLAHTWSLGVEAQFYLLFPVLMWCSGFGRQARHGARNLALWLGVLGAASLAAFIHLYGTNQPAAYFLMPTRFWELAAGCLLSIGVQSRARVVEVLATLPPLPVVVAMVGVMLLPVQAAVPATLLIVASAALLMLCLRPGTGMHALFTHPRMMGIGVVSYALYLWHWSVLSLSEWSIGIHGWSLPFQVTGMVALAILSTRWIEQPARRLDRPADAWVAIGCGVLASGLAAAGLLALNQPLSRRLFLGRDDPHQALMTGSRNATGRQALEDPQYSGRRCHLQTAADQVPSTCTIEPEQASRSMLFLGNSHSDHYRETHALLARRHGVRIEGVSVSGCVFPPDPAQRACGKAQQRLEAHVSAQAGRGDVVVIANRYAIDAPETGWLNGRASLERLNRFARRLLARGVSVVVVGPSPEFSIDARLCIRYWFRPQKPACKVTLAQMRQTRSRAYTFLRQLDPRIMVFDPLPPLCRDGLCSLIDAGNSPLFLDRNHLTDHANRTAIYPAFVHFLNEKQLLAGGGGAGQRHR